MALRLSVLDQSPIPEGASPGDALRNSIDLARLAERSGFRVAKSWTDPLARYAVSLFVIV